MSTTEQWRTVAGWPDYEVSNLGRVRSLKYGRTRLLKGYISSHGYPTVGLCTPSRHRTPYKRSIHVLVMEAFVGPRPEGLVIRHLDGDGMNNNLSNLAYGTPSENQFDQVAHGVHIHASKTKCSHGHPFDERNTYITKAGARACRTCHRLNARMARERQLLRAAGIRTDVAA